jgi:hypothetical protein
MVPDDLIKPQHLDSAISQLTPSGRPDNLTDEVWGLIEDCVDRDPDFDAVETHECLADGPCSEEIENSRLISLSMVLYVLRERQGQGAASRRHYRGRN